MKLALDVRCGHEAPATAPPVPPHWPAGIYPAEARGYRDARGCRWILSAGRWRRLSEEARRCAQYGQPFYYFRRTVVVCSRACGREYVANRNRSAVGAANPNWRGGVSGDNMRYRRRQRERWPKRDAARAAVTRAVATGELVPEPCETCGSLAVHAHHDDYARPLDVRWLCVKHHRERHGGRAVGGATHLARTEAA